MCIREERNYILSKLCYKRIKSAKIIFHKSSTSLVRTKYIERDEKNQRKVRKSKGAATIHASPVNSPILVSFTIPTCARQCVPQSNSVYSK